MLVALKPLLDSSITWFVLELLVVFFHANYSCHSSWCGELLLSMFWMVVVSLGQDSAPLAVLTVACSHPLSCQHPGPGSLPEAAMPVETYSAKPLLWFALCCAIGAPTGVQLWLEEESHGRFCLAPLGRKGIWEMEMKMFSILCLWWWHLYRDGQEHTPWVGAIFGNIIRLVMNAFRPVMSLHGWGSKSSFHAATKYCDIVSLAAFPRPQESLRGGRDPQACWERRILCY